MTNTSWKSVGCGCCAGVVLLGFLFFLVLVLGTKRLAAEVVAADITEYVRLVERAEIDEGLREDLLDQLERIRARASHGEVGFFSWLDHEESLEDLVEDGTLTDREAAAFERELDRLEEELDAPRRRKPRDEESRPLVHGQTNEQRTRAAPSGLGILDFRSGPTVELG